MRGSYGCEVYINYTHIYIFKIDYFHVRIPWTSGIRT